MHISDLIPWGRDKEKTSAGEGASAANPLAALQNDINHVVEDFWHKIESSWNDGGTGMFGPSTDVTETDNSVDVSVELPGMTEKDIDISLSDTAMTIRGEKHIEHQEDRKGVHIRERSYGSFYRMIPLPVGVDTNKAEAVFKNGVLTVSLPKTSGARASRIPVKAG